MDVFFDWRRDEKIALAEMILSFIMLIVGLMSIMVLWLYFPENITLRYMYAIIVLMVSASILHVKNVDTTFLWLTILLFIIGWIISDVLFHETVLMLVVISICILVPVISWFYFHKVIE